MIDGCYKLYNLSVPANLFGIGTIPQLFRGKKIEPLPQSKIGVNPVPCLFIKCISTEFQKPPEAIFEYLFSIGKQSSVLSWQYSRSVDSVSP